MTPDDVVYLGNHLWQSTLFAGAVWLLALAWRKNRAAVRHSLWLAASVKFLIPFSLLAVAGSQLRWLATPGLVRVPVLVESIGRPFGASDMSLVAIPGGATSSGSLNSIAGVLFLVWVVGLFANILWWFMGWLKLRRAIRGATPLSINVPIRTLMHRGRLEPGVVGIFRPVLLLPEGITERLSPAQLQAVVSHELCHVRRRDNLTAAIHMFVEALFWFHPLVWWIRLRLIDEQERACDEEVLRRGGDPQIYAESILKVCECYLASRSMCVSGITSSNLKKRIGDIMRNHAAVKLSFSRVLLLAIVAIAALAGPIVMGVAGVETVGAQPEPAVPQTSPMPAPQTALATPAAPQAGTQGPGTTQLVQDYRLGEIRVVGATVFNADLILSTLGLVSGGRFDESQLRTGFQNLMKLYGSRGYVQFLPEPAVEVDEPRRVVNLTINIQEGDPYTVHRVGFTGNTTTPDSVLRREFLVKEGEVFNASLLELSLLRLNQLGLFEEIKIEDVRVDPSPVEPSVDVDLRVREKAR